MKLLLFKCKHFSCLVHCKIVLIMRNVNFKKSAKDVIEGIKKTFCYFLRVIKQKIKTV